MTNEEKAELRKLLAAAKGDKNLGYEVYEPGRIGQKIDAINQLIAALNSTANSAGPRARIAIRARIEELKARKSFWQSSRHDDEWKAKKVACEKALALVSELEAVIPEDPPPPEPPPDP